MAALQKRIPWVWGDVTVSPGESRKLRIAVSESYSGMTIRIPVFVRRGTGDGPAVFVTAAVHGDEINGTGAIRTLIQDGSLELTAGVLILVPVVNMLGFDRHSRYLPDRRDLNRCFPGSTGGSLARRMARVIFEEIVGRCDFGIDLHTAAIRRTNFPNVRADTSNSEVKRLAKAFGSEIVIDGVGPVGALRREACAAGCPTIIFEGGEIWKVQPAIVETAVRGVRNVLAVLGMTNGVRAHPAYQTVIRKTKWVRSEKGGFLQFHVRPGDIVIDGEPLATNTSLLGDERNTLTAPFPAVVLGMTTLPSTSPGEPVCHLGRLTKDLAKIRNIRERLSEQHLHERVLGELASNVLVVDRPPEKEMDDG